MEGVVRVLGGRRVLDGVDLRVPEHGRVGIVGRSGSGKSTLLSLIAGLDAPDAGSISVGLADCALMPQRDCLLPWRSALDNACLALENRGLPRAEARRRALPLFARLGLGRSEQLPPAKLSGGMRASPRADAACRQRGAAVDEPSGRSDAITRSELQQGLERARPRAAHRPAVTHDVEEALHCDRVLVLRTGGSPPRSTSTPRAISDPDRRLREQLSRRSRGRAPLSRWPDGRTWEIVVRATGTPDYLFPRGRRSRARWFRCQPARQRTLAPCVRCCSVTCSQRGGSSRRRVARLGRTSPRAVALLARDGADAVPGPILAILRLRDRAEARRRGDRLFLPDRRAGRRLRSADPSSCG